MRHHDSLPLSNDHQEHATAPTPPLNRRHFLRLTAAGMGLLATAPAFALDRERALSFYCTHTSETLRLVYWTPTEGYLRESLQEVNYAFRDHYNGLVKRIDKHLLDLLYALRLKLQPRQPINILCGYRSPQTNAMLRRHHSGVAKNSFHMYGQAVDIRMPGHSLTDLHRAAVSLKMGGVGLYRRSDFVHVDTGPVRYWG